MSRIRSPLLVAAFVAEHQPLAGEARGHRLTPRLHLHEAVLGIPRVVPLAIDRQVGVEVVAETFQGGGQEGRQQPANLLGLRAGLRRLDREAREERDVSRVGIR